jgi:hypothetical protein
MSSGTGPCPAVTPPPRRSRASRDRGIAPPRVGPELDAPAAAARAPGRLERGAAARRRQAPPGRGSAVTSGAWGVGRPLRLPRPPSPSSGSRRSQPWDPTHVWVGRRGARTTSAIPAAPPNPRAHPPPRRPPVGPSRPPVEPGRPRRQEATPAWRSERNRATRPSASRSSAAPPRTPA